MTTGPGSRPHRSLLAPVATALVLLVAGACGDGSSRGSGSSIASLLPMPSIERGGLSAGGKFTLALAGGTLEAWGDNASGELGDGTTTSRTTPVAVQGLPAQVVAFASGNSFSLAVLTDGTVWGWGHNASGQLGDDNKADRPTPKQIAGVRDARAVAAGDGFAMALEADGSVLAWGNNQSGQLGDGNAPQDHSTPAVVAGLGAGSGVVAIAAGSSFGVVLKADGSVLAWGNGTSGQLGDGQKSKQSAPTPVQGLGSGSGVRAISAGGSHVVALKADGSVLAWGNNQSGQLGDGTAPADHESPVSVTGLGAGTGVVAIAAGDSFSLALKADGSVLAWGNNQSGQLGDGTAPADQHTPVTVGALAAGAARAVAAGGSHSVALAQDGSRWAWGNNSSGQLGDGTAPTDHATPVQVKGRA